MKQINTYTALRKMPDTSLKCYIVTAITMQIKNVYT